MYLGINEIEIDAAELSIYALLQKVETILDKKFIFKLIDKHKQIIPGTMILINGRNIWHLSQLDSIATDGDEISIFPPGGGG